jgi:hypothetical protein
VKIILYSVEVKKHGTLLSFSAYVLMVWSLGTGTTLPFMAEALALLGSYVVYVGNYLPLFRDDLSVPSSRVKQYIFLDSMKMGPMLSRNIGNHLQIYATSQESDGFNYTAAEP